jgi:hypothetical protein
MHRIASCGLLVTLLSCSLSCKERATLGQVSGKVTFDGAPLPAGVIYFNPGPENSGPQGYAVVKDGTYTTADSKGRPVGSGAYEVRIQGFDGQPRSELPLGSPLFPVYQQAIDLPEAVSTLDFDVPSVKK